MQWLLPVIPATWEVEAGESLELGGGGFNEPRLHHCTSAWVTEQDSVSKNKQTKNPKSCLTCFARDNARVEVVRGDDKIHEKSWNCNP